VVFSLYLATRYIKLMPAGSHFPEAGQTLIKDINCAAGAKSEDFNTTKMQNATGLTELIMSILLKSPIMCDCN